MNCSNCKHWFCNPRIEISDDVIMGRCMLSGIYTQGKDICNAWELSQIAEWKDENEKLTARIAELEKDNDEFRQLIHDWIIILTPDDGYVPDSECNDVATPIDAALRKRIAELEGKIDQLTAHSDIERQDDKSSNDTQTSTIVYGKEREE